MGEASSLVLVKTIQAKNTGFETKTLWDWMDLFIIPLVLAIGAFFLNRSESVVERQIAEDCAKLEREIATDRQQEAALQSYLDRMAELLLVEKLRTTDVEEVRDVARTRTISIMRVLDARRNNLVVQFLREALLIVNKKSILHSANMAEMNLQDLLFSGVYLQAANLQGANMEGINLDSANLQGAKLKGANLKGADMSITNLQDANLQDANLLGAYLWDAILFRVNLRGANLKGAFLMSANLQDANLQDANMQDARLPGAILLGADLKGASLQGAEVTPGQLAEAKSLQNTIMPDGTIHE